MNDDGRPPTESGNGCACRCQICESWGNNSGAALVVGVPRLKRRLDWIKIFYFLFVFISRKADWLLWCFSYLSTRTLVSLLIRLVWKASSVQVGAAHTICSAPKIQKVFNRHPRRGILKRKGLACRWCGSQSHESLDRPSRQRRSNFVQHLFVSPSLFLPAVDLFFFFFSGSKLFLFFFCVSAASFLCLGRPLLIIQTSRVFIFALVSLTRFLIFFFHRKVEEGQRSHGKRAVETLTKIGRNTIKIRLTQIPTVFEFNLFETTALRNVCAVGVCAALSCQHNSSGVCVQDKQNFLIFSVFSSWTDAFSRVLTDFLFIF